MANYPSFLLTGKTPAATYTNVVQHVAVSSSLVDGLGNEFFSLNVTASNAISASWAPGSAQIEQISCSWASSSLSSSYLSASTAIITNAFITTGTYGFGKLSDNQTTYSVDFSSFYMSVDSTQPELLFVSSSNANAVRETSVIIYSQSIDRNISFNPNWIVLDPSPLTISASKTAILTVTSYGPTESDIVVSIRTGAPVSQNDPPAAIPMLMLNLPAFGYKICGWDTALGQMTTSSCTPSIKPNWDGTFDQVSTTNPGFDWSPVPYPVWYFTGSSIGGNSVSAEDTTDWPSNYWQGNDNFCKLFWYTDNRWHLQLGCANGTVWWVGTGNGNDINNPTGSYFIDNGTFGAINLGTTPETIVVKSMSDVCPPSPPSGSIVLMVNSSSAASQLTWSYTDTDQDGFIIDRSSDGITYSILAPLIDSASVRTYQDVVGPVYTDTTYWYRVSAYNGAGAISSNTGSAFFKSPSIQLFVDNIGIFPSGIPDVSAADVNDFVIGTWGVNNPHSCSVKNNTPSNITIIDVQITGSGFETTGSWDPSALPNVVLSSGSSLNFYIMANAPATQHATFTIIYSTSDSPFVVTLTEIN